MLTTQQDTILIVDDIPTNIKVLLDFLHYSNFSVSVAHEINNPVNFIEGNLHYAEQYIQQLLKLLHLYETYTYNSIPEIESYSKAIELDFIKQDLCKLLSSMTVGTERIQQIVRSLRIFSRLDEAECKSVNLHDGIDSTLMILGSRLQQTQNHPEIEIVKEYGNLPLVKCCAGQINQVFMNILTNAIDAIQESFVNEKGQIKITTELTPDEKSVLIRIVDNGVGISEDVRQKIFDQFFTTKPVGNGTGLGLAIAYSIVVDKHGGSLTCHSKLGEGTAFTLPSH
ncbi:MAG: hybrid sensor histidine kinase/response regulator [Hassallia sp.]